MILELCLMGLTLSLFLWVLNGKEKLYNLPPGPKGLPFIGNLHLLRNGTHIKLMRLGKIYGNIFSLKFGSLNVLVLNNQKDIRDALAEPVFSGRPFFTPSMDQNIRSPRGIATSWGHTWTEQHRFAVKSFRELGFGKKSVESIVQEEIIELLETIQKNVGQPIQTEHMFSAATVNVIWRIVAGQRFPHDDHILHSLIKGLIVYTQSSKTTMLRFVPFLYFLWTKMTPFLGQVKEKQETLRKNAEFVNNVVKEHQNTFQMDAEPRDFIDVYLKEIMRTTDETSSFYKEEGSCHIRRPLSLYHVTTKATIFRGYDIPQGTLVIPNLYAAMHDPHVWGDPEMFRPERFLTADEYTLLRNDAYMPFGAGRRACIGMALAQDELFLFISSLFQKFRVRHDPDSDELTADFVGLRALMPKPQNLIIDDRLEEL